MKSLYVFWGKVKEGKKRGKSLGFPTANIFLHKKIPEGIYVSWTKAENTFHQSLTFVGNAKTFNETLYQAEIYFLKYNQSIYGKWLTNYLLQKIRNNQKFSSVQALKKQMEKDRKKGEAFFSGRGKALTVK